MSWLKFIFSKAFLLNVIIALVLVAVALFAGMQYLNTFTHHGEELSVPDFSGYHYSELKSIAESHAMRVQIIDSVYYSEADPGVVISQNPKPNARVKENRKIYITINANKPPSISLPALEDLSLRQALSILQTVGLESGKLLYEPNICMNCVIRMEMDSVEVEAGTSISKGDTVDLVLGKGLSNKLIVYPILVGKKLEEVSNILRKRGLNLGAVNYENCKTKEDTLNAVIFKQIPDIFETEVINLGQSINVFLATDEELIPKLEIDSNLRLIKTPDGEIPPF